MQNLVCLIVGAAQDFVFCLVNPLVFLHEPLLVMLCLFADFFRLFPFFFRLGARVLKSGHYIFKALCITVYKLTGSFNNFPWQTEFAGDGERITLAGNTHKKAIGRLKGFYVKFTGSIFYAVCRERIDLQLTVMCRSHCGDIFVV